MCQETEEELRRGEKASYDLAVHLYNMGASRIEPYEIVVGSRVYEISISYKGERK